MIFKLSTLHRIFFTYFCPTFYGGPPSTPSNTTSTVNQNTIPKELMPYATGMLQAAKQQLYTTDSAGKITGYQPYKPFSADPSKYFAGFTPLQQQAQQGAADMQMPGQFGVGTGLAAAGGMGQLNTAGQAQNIGIQGGLGYGGMGAGLGAQSVQAGQNLQNTYTDPNAMSQYMNPYIQNALNPALQLQNQSFGMKGAEQQSNATRSGAFGGSREALMNSLNSQSNAMANQQMIGTAYSNAYQNAQTAAQQANQAQLQGLQQGMQGAGIGLQGVGQALQGVQGAQAGYAGATNAAQTLGQLGGQQQQSYIDMLNTQNAAGSQQQQYNQGIINQDVLNYQNAVNQPYLAAGTMSDLIRGTPVNNVTQTTYQAQPGIGQQLGGALGSAASLYGAYNSTKKANGGIIQAYAEGGITDVSAVSSYLDKLTVPQLETLLAKSTSVENSKTIQDVIDSKSGERDVQTAKNGGILRFNGKHGSSVEDKDKEDDSIASGLSALYHKGIIGGLEHAGPIWKKHARNMYEGVKQGAIGAYGLSDKLGKAVLYGADNPSVEQPQPTDTTAAPVNTQQPAPTENPKAITAAAPVNTSDLPGSIVGAQAANPLDKPKINLANSSGIVGAQPNTPANTGANTYLDRTIHNAMVNQNMTQPVVSNADERGAPKDEANYDGMEEDKRLSKMSAEDIMRERNEEKKRLGILSPEDMGAEQRKQIMEERANAKDEMKRNTYVRMAEFFANWGSTPGAPLVAGLKALKETIPGYMEDTKAHHKLVMDLNKSIRDMDMAVNLEKSGQYDKASSIKESVSERLQKHGETMALMAVKKEIAEKENASAERRAEIGANASVRSDVLRANPNGASGGWNERTRSIAEAKVTQQTEAHMKTWASEPGNKYGTDIEARKQAERDRAYRQFRKEARLPDDSGTNNLYSKEFIPPTTEEEKQRVKEQIRKKAGMPVEGAQ